ncbi:MAG: sodium/proline symporter PutP [Candidatus Hydrogenedentota bacterium]
MPENNASINVVFVIYLAAMLGLGVLFFRRTESTSDYFLGDRKLDKWVAALSAQASDMSGWLLLGLPGAAYLSGLSASWIAVGLLVGTYLNWRFVARRLRHFTGVSEEIITISDYLERRFREKRKLLRIISALFILVFFMIYTSSGFVAGGKLFSTVFHIPYTASLLLGAAVVVSYTFLGGFNAVCWTDFFQGTLMFIAILVVPVLILDSAAMSGMVRTSFEELTISDPTYFTAFGKTHAGVAALIIGTVSSLAWGLGYFGQPHILVRFMAIRSADDVPVARRIAMVWVTLSLAGAVAVGILGRMAGPMLEGPDAEKIFMVLVRLLFPGVLAGVFLAAILAAIMSTADSQLLVTTSAFTEDFYRSFLRKKAGNTELVWVSRLTVVGVALAALLMAFVSQKLVFALVAYAWAGFGATFGPVLLGSLFWRRMTWQGALCGMIIGGLTVLFWGQIDGGIFDLYEIVPGFLLSTLTIIVVSLLTPPSEEAAEEFDRLVSELTDPDAALEQ